MARDGAVIIKRIKKGGGDGHHGGAWKVAYADFVTAMMAFFLLMWLINTTTPEQKRGIADYFAAQSISKSSSGSGSLFDGRVFGAEGARAGGAVSAIHAKTPPKPSKDAKSTTEGDKGGGGTGSQGDASQSQVTSDDSLQRRMVASEDRNFQQAEISLRQAMQEMPDIAELSRHILVDQTPEGLRIQLVDQDGRAMFVPGTAELTPAARRLLKQVGHVVDRLPNRITVSGHTDAAMFTAPDGTTNWELSAGRANAARAAMESDGVDMDRIYQVAGKAGSEPMLPDDPYAAVNRRISVVLLREAPVVPPGHSL